MGHGHGHGHGLGDDDHDDLPVSAPIRRLLLLIVVPFALATAVGLVVLWPAPVEPPSPEQTGLPVGYVNAEVVTVTERDCGPVAACQGVEVRLVSGPDAGTLVTLPDMQVGPAMPPLQLGDEVVLGRIVSPIDGRTIYNFSDFERRSPMWLLAALFAGIVVAVARWRGLAALAGLGVTWAVLIGFVVPAILDNSNPVAVALVGSSAIMFVVLYLAHGFTARTTVALVGTLTALLVTGILAWVFVYGTRLTGLSSEEAVFLQSFGRAIELRGLLLGGIIIGALGALNDVTVTQASAVWEIHRANPDRPAGELYRAGMRVGRDHIASTVDTLVLAYAGASLPLLLLFVLGSQPLGTILTGEIVAEEIVRTLVGSIGLVASVPLTTGLAALIVARGPVTGAVGDAAAPAASSAPTNDASSAADPRPAGNRVDQARRQRDRRRSGRDDRAEKAAQRWRPPKGEREIWGDDV